MEDMHVWYERNKDDVINDFLVVYDDEFHDFIAAEYAAYKDSLEEDNENSIKEE